MNVCCLTLGQLATNCYLISQAGLAPALLVDAAGDPGYLLSQARARRLRIVAIVLTHAHIDHIEAAAGVKRETSAELLVHGLDVPLLASPVLSGAASFGLPHPAVTADRLLQEGESVALPGTDLSLAVLHTPGHTPGSICLLGGQVLFSGDCLFAGGVGRTDLPGGDDRAMRASLRRLAGLSPTVTVYPGHGPATTIGEERETNPWLEDV